MGQNNRRAVFFIRWVLYSLGALFVLLIVLRGHFGSSQ
jgi:hypothetical protein